LGALLGVCFLKQLESEMYTIRIYRKGEGMIAIFTGLKHVIEQQARDSGMTEANGFIWLR
jgi:hypothetical protein